ncbi:hypothetical protein CYY_003466 [Polysphondylium violaceum]|uniref:Tyrosine-protein kinase ephrin type A/B receptor-like domain-containing protein n=1 Tax=Polysphondylium violaceum TaxID=133409 RepID=A0A8J4PWD7_9MYCE|nr:hypothetical protein CYY_003466 [Polysphondylium violaceum]
MISLQKHLYVVLVSGLLIHLIFFLCSIGGVNGFISTSLFNGYAIIGANPNSKISFATLLKKQNISMPFSKINQYQIVNLFSDQTKLYGSSVALGSTDMGGSNITIGVIGSPNDGTVTIYDIEQCNYNSSNSQCNPLFIQTSNSTTDKHSTTEFQCSIGSTIAVGENFIVSVCQDNLFNTRINTSPISICILDLNKNPTNCTAILNPTINFIGCIHKKGQLFVSSIATHGNKIAVSLCGLCMVQSTAQIMVEYNSTFTVIEVDVNAMNTTQLYPSVTTFHTMSCPSSISFDDEWLALGFPEESSVDLYYQRNGNYQYLETLPGSSETTGFGSSVQVSDGMLFVSAQGSPTQGQGSKLYFFEVYTDQNKNPMRISVEASVPTLNYKTYYDFEYGISYFGHEVLVVSQDMSLTKMGFDFYSVCPAGFEWSSDSQKCSYCQQGQYKTVTNIYSNSSFELCFPCPGGYYSGVTMGLSSVKECMINACNSTEFCPDGSKYPLPALQVSTFSESNPDPSNSEELDFESTFYDSCYPYFLIILGGMLLLTCLLCLPNWNSKAQNAIITKLLKVNFYDWDGEEMTEDIEYLESSPSLQINGVSTLRSSYKKGGIFVRKRRTAVKPVKAVESFCSYYFLIVFVLMCVFIFQFQRVNTDLDVELRSLGQASATPNPGMQYSDQQYLKIIDSSPLIINVDLYGYSGDCLNSEFTLITKGCQTQNYMGNCKFNLSSEIQTASSLGWDSATSNEPKKESGAPSAPLPQVPFCRVTAKFPYGIEYSDTSQFTFTMAPANEYFYVQRMVYNISTNNNASNTNTGNSFVSGIIQPLGGTILRPSASVSILSMLTLLSNCKIKPQKDSGGLALVRAMIEKCSYDPTSFKEFSFISNTTSYLNTTHYHNDIPTFAFDIKLEKSVFYHYVTSSHSVSFGQIVTVIMFAVLDVFWLIEVIVPVVQTFVAFVEEFLKKRENKKTGIYYIENREKTSNEMSKLINDNDREIERYSDRAI